MVSQEDCLRVIADALQVASVSQEDSQLTIEKWDSVGHLVLQIELSNLTDGRTDNIEGFSELTSVGAILGRLVSEGLLESNHA